MDTRRGRSSGLKRICFYVRPVHSRSLGEIFFKEFKGGVQHFLNIQSSCIMRDIDKKRKRHCSEAEAEMPRKHRKGGRSVDDKNNVLRERPMDETVVFAAECW